MHGSSYLHGPRAGRRGALERLNAYVLDNFEQFFVFGILVSVAFINYFIADKIAFINFYFLPVIVAGYLVGLRLSVLGAVFCILLVATYVVLYPQSFVLPSTEAGVYLHLLAWGGFLVLAGAAVGKQQERLKGKIEQTLELNRELQRQVQNVQDARSATMLGLAKLAEYRDEETGRHLERMREYCRIIAGQLARHPQYAGYVTEGYIRDLYLSSILHDIGKVGVPDSILRKPGPLTAEEYEVIKRHTTLGGDVLRAAEEQIEGRSFLSLGKQIAYCHQEKWDGSGYPRGLRGAEIPLSARIVALADAYDAITSARVYKASLSHAEAVRAIRAQRGKHFDPAVVDAFLARAAELDRVRSAMQDAPAAEAPDPLPAAGDRAPVSAADPPPPQVAGVLSAAPPPSPGPVPP